MKTRATIYAAHPKFVRYCERCLEGTEVLYEFGSMENKIRSRPDIFPGSSIQVCEKCKPIFDKLNDGYDLARFRGIGR